MKLIVPSIISAAAALILYKNRNAITSTLSSLYKAYRQSKCLGIRDPIMHTYYTISYNGDILT